MNISKSSKYKPLFIYNIPEYSYAAIVVSNFAKSTKNLIYTLSTNEEIDELSKSISFYSRKIDVVCLYEWDCPPYDSMGPSKNIKEKRIINLVKLKKLIKKNKKFILLTTAGGLLQKIQQLDDYKRLIIKKGEVINYKKFINYLDVFGYSKVDSVFEVGTYSNRGDIIDVYSPNSNHPIRIDFFDNTIERLRYFDANNQKSLKEIDLKFIYPFSEILLSEENIINFKKNFLFHFKRDDKSQIYSSISQGIRPNGIEQYLPLFYSNLVPLYERVPNSILVFNEFSNQILKNKLNEIIDIHKFKNDLDANDELIQHMISPLNYDELYVTRSHIKKIYKKNHIILSNNDSPNLHLYDNYIIEKCTHKNISFDPKDINNNKYDKIYSTVKNLISNNKKIIIASNNTKTAESFLKNSSVLNNHNIRHIKYQDEINSNNNVYLTKQLNNESYIEGEYAFISLNRIFNIGKHNSSFKSKKPNNYIRELTSLNVGDLIVHRDHGLGKFNSLKKINAEGISYDCLELIYKDDDKIHLPVENIEVLSLYSQDNNDNITLDKLGASNWQKRKARVKNKIKEIAHDLINIEAKRRLLKAPIVPVDNRYNEFISHFEHIETEDQIKAEKDIIKDLERGAPMDRLICGDVGFGKTELALRSSFLLSSNGYQVAICAPTTLLAKQHFETFTERFKNFSLNIKNLSRFTSKKDRDCIKDSLKKGDVDIIIGTHSLLNEGIKFNNLGLIIIDEEQSFGVEQKEYLKKHNNNVHILSLTATPIPRSMQLAINGIRDLSIIASPPLGRLPINTSINYFEPTLIKRAVLAEKKRNGQTFIICPKIKDLPKIESFLDKFIPEVNYAIAHGGLSNKDIKNIINDFYNNKYDVLIATSIIQSGLDIPNANTVIITNSHNFGLSQIYQIRGRVGRSKKQSSAYITIPHSKIPKKAMNRLQILQNLGNIGMGFILASHDLDVRGAGNILGSQQSGHIKEVGIELFNSMLMDEIDNIRSNKTKDIDWTPTIKINKSYFIPENYIRDIGTRMNIYKRLSDANIICELNELKDELIDRFGLMPDPLITLIEILNIKIKCKVAQIEKLETVKNGFVIKFRENKVANVDALLEWVINNKDFVKIKHNNVLLIEKDIVNIDISHINEIIDDIGTNSNVIN